MSIVNYGDSFYLYGYATDSAGNVTQGWINYDSNMDGKYYFVCANSDDYCFNGPTTYTILPATSGVKPNGSAWYDLPTPSSNNNTGALNVSGKPVNITNLFYIGFSDVINNTSWNTTSSFMAITGGKGDLNVTSIDYQENEQFRASNVKTPQFTVKGTPVSPTVLNNYFIYGATSFNLSTPYNDTNGQTCSVGGVNINNKNSLLALDTDNSVKSTYQKISTEYNTGSCSAPFNYLTFAFVPVNPYTYTNNAFVPIKLSDYSYKDVGVTPLFFGSSGNTLYGCSNNTCVETSGYGGEYPNINLCNTYCLQIPYSCNSGVCKPDSNGSYANYDECNISCAVGATGSGGPSEPPGPAGPPSSLPYLCSSGSCKQDATGTYKSYNDCTAACPSGSSGPPTTYSCSNGVCKTDAKGSYSSYDDCNAKCITDSSNPPSSGMSNKEKWILGIVIAITILVIIIAITFGIIYYNKSSKKINAP